MDRRLGRALLAGAGAAVAYYTGSAMGSSPQARAIGRGGMLMLAATAAMAAGGTAIKARTTAQRLDAHVAAAAPAINLVANGGTIGGNVVVAGDHHIQGSLYGVGGTITAGDALFVSSNAITADGTITSHANMNATSGTVSGGSIHGTSTTGDSNMGTLAALTDSTQGAASGPTLAEVNACINRVNDILTYLKGGQVSSHNAIIARVNDLLSALG